MSFDPENLDTVASVIRGDAVTIYGSSIAGLGDQYPNIQKLIDVDRKGDPFYHSLLNCPMYAVRHGTCTRIMMTELG